MTTSFKQVQRRTFCAWNESSPDVGSSAMPRRSESEHSCCQHPPSSASGLQRQQQMSGTRKDEAGRRDELAADGEPLLLAAAQATHLPRILA